MSKSNVDRRTFLSGAVGICAAFPHAGNSFGPAKRGHTNRPVGNAAMRRIGYCVVDVFTDRPLAGNPVAVFPDRSKLREDELLPIARELNLSEIVIVEEPRDKSALKRLRIFSHSGELPLAGHPVVGAWHLLADRGFVDLDAAVASGLARRKKEGNDFEEIFFSQELAAGVLELSIYRAAGKVKEVVMDQLPPTFHGSVSDLELIAGAMGIDAQAIRATGLPAEVVSTGGTPKIMIPLATVKDLESVRLDLARFNRLCEITQSRGIYIFTRESPQEWALVRARCFSQAIDGREDPATGSAAGCLGGYLVRSGVLGTAPKAEFFIAQGFEIGRPSRIGVEVTADAERITRIRVLGSAVVVAEAELILPETY